MLRKDSIKKLINMIQWIAFIALLSMGIYYFFISKNAFKGMQWLIAWGLVGIMNAGNIIDSKYFEENFSWKHNWKNIIYLFVSAIIVVREIKKIWL